MQIDVQIVNAFIDGPTGGNPAGVVTDANALSTAQKLKVAQQVGLSETAFVSRSDSATIKLEFFTPTRQIAHCGHATIATFSLLRQIGMVGKGRLSKETIDGNRDILIDGDMVFMEQRAPTYTRVAAASDLADRIVDSLGLTQSRLLDGIEPFVVNTGNSFLVVPLPDERSVSDLRPDLALVESLSEELDLIGYYAFSIMTRDKAVMLAHACLRHGSEYLKRRGPEWQLVHLRAFSTIISGSRVGRYSLNRAG